METLLTDSIHKETKVGYWHGGRTGFLNARDSMGMW